MDYIEKYNCDKFKFVDCEVDAKNYKMSVDFMYEMIPNTSILFCVKNLQDTTKFVKEIINKQHSKTCAHYDIDLIKKLFELFKYEIVCDEENEKWTLKYNNDVNRFDIIITNNQLKTFMNLIEINLQCALNKLERKIEEDLGYYD